MSMGDSSSLTEDSSSLSDQYKQSIKQQGEKNNVYQLQDLLTSYHYENSLIKTELAACLDNHKRELNLIQVKHEYQLKEAKKQEEEAVKVASQIKELTCLEQRKLNQLNLQLSQRIQLMEKENENLKESVTNLEANNSKLEERLVQSANQHTVSTQTLKDENENLKDEIQCLKSDLEKERSDLRELKTNHRLEKQNSHLLKNKILEIDKETEVKIAQIQSEVSQLTIFNANETTKYKIQIADLQKQLEEERKGVREEKLKYNDQEKELNVKINELRQAALSLKTEHLQATLKLHQKIKELENQVMVANGERDECVDKLQEEVSNLTKEIFQQQTDNAILQQKLSYNEGTGELFKKSCKENEVLLEKVQILHKEKNLVIEELREYQQNIKDLSDRTAAKEKQLNDCMANSIKDIQVKEKIIADLKVRHEEKLQQYQCRQTELQSQLSEKGKQYLAETSSLKQKVRMYGQLIKKLRHKLDMGTIREEQLTAQHAALQENIPPDNYRKIHNQLMELTRKHAEFAAFIRGLNEFQSQLPQFNQLTEKIDNISQQLADLEESQQFCLSEVDSL